MHTRVVRDIPEVLFYRRLDGDDTQCGPKLFDQFFRVSPRPVGGAKARQGQRQYSLAVKTEQVESLHCHEQGQCGIETTGDAEYNSPGASVLDALGQTGRLDRENFTAWRVD